MLKRIQSKQGNRSLCDTLPENMRSHFTICVSWRRGLRLVSQLSLEKHNLKKGHSNKTSLHVEGQGGAKLACCQHAEGEAVTMCQVLYVRGLQSIPKNHCVKQQHCYQESLSHSLLIERSVVKEGQTLPQLRDFAKQLSPSTYSSNAYFFQVIHGQ